MRKKYWFTTKNGSVVDDNTLVGIRKKAILSIEKGQIPYGEAKVWTLKNGRTYHLGTVMVGDDGSNNILYLNPPYEWWETRLVNGKQGYGVVKDLYRNGTLKR